MTSDFLFNLFRLNYCIKVHLNTLTFPNYMLLNLGAVVFQFFMGVASSGPLKYVEIDFLKIEIINFVIDTPFLLLNHMVLIK